MPEASSGLDQLKEQGRRFAAKLRPRHFAAIAALAVALVGVAGVRALAVPRPSPVPDGERLQIQVVAPEEPPIAPGPVMEVGALVDGFEGVPPPRPAAEPLVSASWDEAWDEEADAPDAPDMRPPPRRPAEDLVFRPPPRPEAPARDWRDSPGARWFGFDAPDRDYRAEREARRARFEARMERDRDRDLRRHRSDGFRDGDDRGDRRRREADRPRAWEDRPAF